MSSHPNVLNLKNFLKHILMSTGSMDIIQLCSVQDMYSVYFFGLQIYNCHIRYFPDLSSTLMEGDIS